MVPMAGESGKLGGVDKGDIEKQSKNLVKGSRNKRNQRIRGRKSRFLFKLAAQEKKSGRNQTVEKQRGRPFKDSRNLPGEVPEGRTPQIRQPPPIRTSLNKTILRSSGSKEQ